ncbi:ankyrin repeat domain-containing protein [Desulfobotulus sp. H1]|uniref:Ankyrin repeat domain-containing protein n=1 Tax=Desulfobotulus pelophilus TaxID=2823377 RepID=A0ABT3N7H2_9BACT|nr:ankyrin repeat domain-containing protein [Desulfobotulus pelophilus]MCW7753401.1 ankyrin repeat domain-containing protein [Desulfobotulus pelophilus]
MGGTDWVSKGFRYLCHLALAGGMVLALFTVAIFQGSVANTGPALAYGEVAYRGAQAHGDQGLIPLRVQDALADCEQKSGLSSDDLKDTGPGLQGVIPTRQGCVGEGEYSSASALPHVREAASLPDVRLSLFADPETSIPVSGRYSRIDPLFLKIEMTGGTMPGKDEADLFFRLVRQNPEFSPPGGEGQLAPGGRTFSFPLPRTFVTTLDMEPDKVLPAGDYILTLVLRSYEDHLAGTNGGDSSHQLSIQIVKDRSELNYELLMASHDGDLKAVQKRLAEGANVHFSDGQGLTALHYAALFNHRAVMEFLLQKGAAIQAMDYRGNPPGYYLYWGYGQKAGVAARYGYREPEDKKKQRAAAQAVFREMMEGMGQGIREGLEDAARASRSPVFLPYDGLHGMPPVAGNERVAAAISKERPGTVVRYEVRLGPSDDSILEDHRGRGDHWNGYGALGWQEAQGRWPSGEVKVTIAGHTFWMAGVDAERLVAWLNGRMKPVSRDNRWDRRPGKFRWKYIQLMQWTENPATPSRVIYEGRISSTRIVIGNQGQ